MNEEGAKRIQVALIESAQKKERKRTIFREYSRLFQHPHTKK